jgi:4-amino-4-deoxy-L-arabinose transferase-like glycosyltransferase
METFCKTDVSDCRKKIMHAIFWLVIGVIFFATRFFGLSQPYHQDEYKWALIVSPIHYNYEGIIPHPPLAEKIYAFAGALFGLDYLRIVPAFGSLVLLIGIYLYLKDRFSRSAAYVAIVIFTANLYALIASLQIDIDGILLPLFIFTTLVSYEYLQKALPDKRRRWIILFFVGFIGGCFVKLSFVLAPIAIFIYELPRIYARAKFLGFRGFAKNKWYVSSAFFVLFLLITVSLFFKQVYFVEYIRNFFGSADSRNVTQLIVLTAKSLIYASPVLVVGLFLGIFEYKKLRIWYIFLLLSFIFYFVLFDFSHRTLDRYLMFIILPSTIIGGVALGQFIDNYNLWNRKFAAQVLIVSSIIAFPVYLMIRNIETILPLLPKTLIFEHIKSLDFSVLIPLSGGSGPLGFYFPLNLVIYTWFFTLSLAGIFMCRKFSERIRTYSFILFIATCLVSSVIGIEEYIYGGLFGSVSVVEKSLLNSIENDLDIKQVITYNDIGAFELSKMGKYYKRFYIHPQFIGDNVIKFNSFDGYYLVLNFPALDKDSIYTKFFSTCSVKYRTVDKLVSGEVFDCRGKKISNN